MYAGYDRGMLKNAPRLAISSSVAKVQVRAAHFGSLVSTVTAYSDWNSRVKESVWLVLAYRAVMLALLHAVKLARLWVAVLHAKEEEVERRTHEERRKNYDVTRWLPLRAVTSRVTNV